MDRRRIARVAVTPEEIGLHGCWQLIAERDIDCGLVLEDDFDVHDACTLQALQTLAASATGAHPWDVLKLTRLRKDSKLVATLGDDGAGLALRFGGKGPEDGTAYMVSRRGAAKLTPKREHLLRPVDFELKHHWERDLTVYSAGPDLFWQVGSNEPSGKFTGCTIHDGRNWVCKPGPDAARSITLEMRLGQARPGPAPLRPFRAVSKWRWLPLQGLTPFSSARA